jgi:hypothetical protein
MVAPLVLEGTWDEISARADELRGWRLRVVGLSRVDAARREQPATADSSGQSRTPGSPSSDTGMDQVRNGEPDTYPVSPFFSTDESSLPFDLPRPGEAVLVPYVDGGERLPEFPPEWRDGEQCGV